jgi:hypothetical protein
MAQIEIENMDMELPIGNEDLLKDVVAKLKILSLADQQKCMVQLVAFMAKGVREASKLLEKAAKTPKRKSPHLAIHRDWTAYVLQDAKMNGWPSFSVTITKKDKSIEMKSFESSVMNEKNEHVFSDTKKPISSATAAQLAKFYWSKDNGANKELYEQFMANRPMESVESNSSSTTSSASSSPKKSKKTEEEKAAIKKAAQDKKDADKIKKALEREATAAKKNEAEKAKLLAKLAEIENPSPKSASKSKKSKKTSESEIPSSAIAAVAAVAASSSPPTKRLVMKKAKENKDDFVPSAPNDPDVFDPWVFQGNNYARNCMNEIANEEDEVIGTYDPKTNTIQPIDE